MRDRSKIVVVGSGPNGLAAALTLLRAGRAVHLFEGNGTVGGGCRSSALFGPDTIVDHCASVIPFAGLTPMLASVPVTMIEPVIALAHPFDDGTALSLHRDLDQTANQFGDDERAYRDLVRPLLDPTGGAIADLLKPFPISCHPLRMLDFARDGLRSASSVAARRFRDDQVRAFFLGLGAHSSLPLDAPGSAAFGIVLTALAHLTGWPFVCGGTQKLVDSATSAIIALGGIVETGRWVVSTREFPDATVLLDTSVEGLATIGRDDLPRSYLDRLKRFRLGPGCFKVDYILSEPIPWTAADCRLAGTLHLGGTAAEIELSEQLVHEGRVSDRPFVILSQPSVIDSSRAPAGQQVVAAYCHVPNGFAGDVSALIDAQIERFAPGFAEVIFERIVTTPADFEAGNPNLVGGDIAGGAPWLGQLWSRPVLKRDVYRTPNERIYLCSASTPPGGGVHGMCGVNAARSLLRRSD